MWYRNNRNPIFQGLTLVEVLVAVAVMAIIFAVIVPQLRVTENSWDNKVGAAETLQNGRVLMDHINRNLSKAVRITAVSDSSETNGYIEFIDNDANNLRYDIDNGSNYVEFGPSGALYDLAGPVSHLLFTCFDSNNFTTPITDVNSIRFIKVETTLINPAKLGQDMTFSTQAYIQTNALPAPAGGITKMSEPWFEFDVDNGEEPALAPIDSTHYLCAYHGPGNNGWAVVLTVDTDTWDVSKELAFEYDVKNGIDPALAKIDDKHYLLAYQGDLSDGWAKILNVNTGTWTISEKASFEFDQSYGGTPALVQIDQNHYLSAYKGPGDDGWAVVLTIATPLFDSISMGTPLEFDTLNCEYPALSKIDDNHYLCVYQGDADDGWATVLTVDTGTWTITNETPYEFDTLSGLTPALSKIDDTHYLCAYTGQGAGTWAVVLTVDTGNWTISRGTHLNYDPLQNGNTPALQQIDSNNFLCAYSGGFSWGWMVVLTVDTGNWTINAGTPFQYDGGQGKFPELSQIDATHYLCAYQGLSVDGFAGVLALSNEIRP